VALLLSSGCRRGPAHLGLGRVELSQSAAGERLLLVGIGDDDLREAARVALLGAGFEAAPAGDLPRDWRGYSGKVTVLASAAEPGVDGGARSVAVVVELEAAPVDGEAPLRARERGAGAPQAGEEGLGGAFRRALTSALGGAASSISLDLAEGRKPERELLRDLRSPERRTRDAAVRALADRKNGAAVPGLVERLRDEDPEVIERAVGALAQLGDERAVDPLIELSLRRGPEVTSRLARVVGDIGGPEARAYLLTLASGHPDQGVRLAAAEALGEAEARERERAQAGR
jgi:hypothetical protein